MPQSWYVVHRSVYDGNPENPAVPPHTTLFTIVVAEMNATDTTFAAPTKFVCAILTVTNVAFGGTGIVHDPVLPLIQSITHAKDTVPLGSAVAALRFTAYASRGSSGLNSTDSAGSAVTACFVAPALCAAAAAPVPARAITSVEKIPLPR